jgi:hypothetical protein
VANVFPKVPPGSQPTCESCLFIDVREWRRQGLLLRGLCFACSWPSGSSIDVRIDADGVVLTFKGREQRVSLVRTRCHLGGTRPWLLCSAPVGGRPCGRRVAKLYLRGQVFACRQCSGLAYASQSKNPRYRAIGRAQKLRMRLGGLFWVALTRSPTRLGTAGIGALPLTVGRPRSGGSCPNADLRGWVVLGGNGDVQSEAVIFAVERHGKIESRDKKSRPLWRKVST